MTIDPAPCVLSVERHFTNPEQHPYDTVQWVRKDARITNLSTGVISFEQATVEVPATWSQNAVNILAQKYFRGALGSPDRESSLKQVLDRIVDTITAWGKQYGHLSDEAEVNTFNAELKFLLLHQNAAFNSPVWFNIGVADTPAQASACFILSADDEMHSIMEWYNDESVIFKGGSGAGINLSRLRSSMEPLKGGGTASGPVSFMRGADSSAGTIKCLAKGTLVLTDMGLLPIEQVQPGMSVITKHGLAKVDALHDNGVQPLLRLRTRLNTEVVCTPEHRFWVRSVDGKESWKTVAQIEPNDYVALDMSAQENGSLQPLASVVTSATSEEGVTQPEHLTEDLASWFGWVWGGGDAADHKTLCIAETGKAHLNGVKQSCNQTDDAAPSRVPQSIFRSPAPVKAAFLSGLFEANGTVGKAVSLTAKNRAFAQDVQQLLLSLGIPARLTEALSEDRRVSHNLWHLSLMGDEAIARYTKHVGFLSSHKNQELAELVERSKDAHDATWTLPHVAQELNAVWLATDNQSLRQAIAQFCQPRESARQQMSLPMARSLLERFPAELSKTSIAQFVFGDMFWSPVEIQPNVQATGPVYDLTVHRVHEYVVSGMITHNSGGKTRRAAKMVVLDVDHPDIEEFIWCKAIEERKARVLRDSGFSMDLGGLDSYSLQYQNANNSVRITDAFMQAVADDAPWPLTARKDGSVVHTLPARDLFRQIAYSAWECADPGVQFDTTINNWHTLPNTDRIRSSNPCFHPDTLIATDRGLIRIEDLVQRAIQGETFGVYTHDITNEEHPFPQMVLSSPVAYMVTGINEIVRLELSDGSSLRVTPNHKIWTDNRGYVRADELTAEDTLHKLDMPAPAVAADYSLPVSSDWASYRRLSGNRIPLHFPEKWTTEFAHFLGWLTGNGSISPSGWAIAYDNDQNKAETWPCHKALLEQMLSGWSPTVEIQSDGAWLAQINQSVFTDFLLALGVKPVEACEKQMPWSVMQAPTEIQAAFLRGLFDANGTVTSSANGHSQQHVQLGSLSRQLLQEVQQLLGTFGICSTIHPVKKTSAQQRTHIRNGRAVTINQRQSWQLHVDSGMALLFQQQVGFALSHKQERLLALAISSRSDMESTSATLRLIERVDEAPALTFNLTEPRNHSVVANNLVVRQCSEYMSIDNSACNLSSVNLMCFLNEDDSFDVVGYQAAVKTLILAMDILVAGAEYPTEKIAENTRRFRQLGIGYANLGALLMANGLPYDSDKGRAWAAVLTAILSGQGYATSAQIASKVGPFAGFADNADPMLGVLHKHQAALEAIDPADVPPELLHVAKQTWQETVNLAEVHGVRNSQISVLAPTGCLSGSSLVTSDRGVLPLGTLGDVDGPQWQNLDLQVATDEGPRSASKFYVNGLVQTVRMATRRGYELVGTPQHRIKVVDQLTGEFVWKELGQVKKDNLAPLHMGMVGDPQEVRLPALPPMNRSKHGSDHAVWAPENVTPALAELVGYFQGDGSVHHKGLRLCVANGDLDVIERLRILSKELFGLPISTRQEAGHVEVAISSTQVVSWWESCGFAKVKPLSTQSGCGYLAHVPVAILRSNDPAVYGAFLRGLFEADGTLVMGVPELASTSIEMLKEIQTLLLSLSIPSARRVETIRTGFGSQSCGKVRVAGVHYNERFSNVIGFISNRKNAKMATPVGNPTDRDGASDCVPMTEGMLDRLVPENGRLRRIASNHLLHGRWVPRPIAEEIYSQNPDPELAHLLSFFYDSAETIELGEEELTYDLSVPSNTTYVANGFISHNTIALLMDCDTTGIEPDLGLVKLKKLVGGGTMSIVNQTVPRALRQLGYQPNKIDQIVAYIDEHKTIVGSPDLLDEHLPVFACSMGDNAIHYRGHIRMMGAVQPFISGAISKTVNLPEEATIQDVEQLYAEAWTLGIKAVAIYRDNCKVAQPLAIARKASSPLSVEERDSLGDDTSTLVDRVVQLEQALEQERSKRPDTPPRVARERLPQQRSSKTFSFSVGDCEGYLTVGEYEDGRPGETFIKVSKQGSTLSGIMDAFSLALSLGLQHGVPLSTFVNKFSGMKFEPAGLTDDPELRIATSLIDYVVRRVALTYLSHEERKLLGVLSTAERIEEVNAVAQSPAAPAPAAPVAPETPKEARVASPATSGRGRASEAPLCYSCGNSMQRAGSCYVCASCGATSGCS